MKVLFIGGTGNISTYVSKLALEKGIDLYLLNRGKTRNTLEGANTITADIYKPQEAKAALEGHTWDAVVNWIAFTPEHIKKDLELFQGKTGQYIFISSASAYEKPPIQHILTESTPLKNPFWQYSRDKIACEELLMKAFREVNFPVTIVRPSHTYAHIIPVSLGGGGEYTIIDRMKKGKKIIIHGDGTSLWTLTHSEDFARAFVPLLGQEKSIGEAFHITSDEVLTWNQIHETIAETIGVNLNPVYISSHFIGKHWPEKKDGLLGDKSHCAIFDNSKIKNLVPEFQAQIPFNEGIQRTLEWFESEPERMVLNEETNQTIDRVINAYHG